MVGLFTVFHVCLGQPLSEWRCTNWSRAVIVPFAHSGRAVCNGRTLSVSMFVGYYRVLHNTLPFRVCRSLFARVCGGSNVTNSHSWKSASQWLPSAPGRLFWLKDEIRLLPERQSPKKKSKTPPKFLTLGLHCWKCSTKHTEQGLQLRTLTTASPKHSDTVIQSVIHNGKRQWCCL